MAAALNNVAMDIGDLKLKRPIWRDKETKTLIYIWRDKISDLLKTKRNKVVYQKIAAELQFYNYSRTWQEVKIKIKNLTSEFRKQKTKTNRTGDSPSTWRYYHAVLEIVGSLPTNNLDLLSESFVDDTEIIATSDKASSSVASTSLTLKDIDSPTVSSTPLIQEHSPSVSSAPVMINAPSLSGMQVISSPSTSSVPQASILQSAESPQVNIPSYLLRREQEKKRKKN